MCVRVGVERVSSEVTRAAGFGGACGSSGLGAGGGASELMRAGRPETLYISRTPVSCADPEALGAASAGGADGKDRVGSSSLRVWWVLFGGRSRPWVCESRLPEALSCDLGG